MSVNISNSAGPDDSPQNVTATAVSSTEIEVSWEEVPAIDQNGVITMYEVRYTPEPRFQGEIPTNTTNTSIMTITLMDLEEYVNYNISVRAYTSEGPGPYSAGVVERTFEAGESINMCDLHPFIIPHSLQNQLQLLRM